MDLREVGWDFMDWINVAQDRDQWQALVYTQNVPVQSGKNSQNISLIAAAFTENTFVLNLTGLLRLCLDTTVLNNSLNCW
jgi:hypothetical protein